MNSETDVKRDVIASIEAEFARYKVLGERAIGQLRDDQLAQVQAETDNSIATMVWHIAGNLTSRFTDFLETDGEKPWRDRESEFAPRHLSHAELNAKWEGGWQILFRALQTLRDDDLAHSITIRGVSLRVHEALHRSLAHTSYHVGQIVYLSKMMRGPDWTYLSIPPGGSDAYNTNPVHERATDHAAAMRAAQQSAKK